MANAREEGSKPGRPETAAGKLPGVFMKYNLKYRKGEMKDYPVLYTAIIEEVDLLVTGDNRTARHKNPKIRIFQI